MKRKTLEQRLNEKPTRRAFDDWKRSNYKARIRLYERVKTIITKEHSYFITFTIAPKYYGYQLDTYIKKAKEALGTASDYVANEDYGTDNGRYHIHAIASYNEQYDYTSSNHHCQSVWKYGAIRFEVVHTPNHEAIGNYINKLSQHATKDTAHRIIYSRKRRA